MTVQDKEANFLNGNDVPTRLKAEAQRFQVRWETLPDHYYVKGQRRQIGFVIVLAGTHEAGVQHPEPGCEHCRNDPVNDGSQRPPHALPKSRCKLGFATDRGLIARWMPAKCGAFEK